MRKIVVMMQTTLNNRIANADSEFWDPFPWGEEEMAYLNQDFRDADTWALSRVLYEVIVPYWDTLARGEVPDDAPVISAADRSTVARSCCGTEPPGPREPKRGERIDH